MPMTQALSLLDPLVVLPSAAMPATGATGWLFHIDVRSVVATHWEAIDEHGRNVGFRARLLATAGRAGRVALRAFKPVASARQIDFLGQTLVELTVEENRIHVEFSAY